MPKRSLDKNSAPFTIVHISDLHAGSQYFISNLLSRTIEELNQLKPSMVAVTGDLTEEGFRHEFRTAKAFLDLLVCKRVIVIPGNHDARNVGEVHFEELFGPRRSAIQTKEATILGVDSSEPDLDWGRVGRESYKWMEKEFTKGSDLKVLAMHHHLLPVPETGRERNIVHDAGDLLEVLLRSGVDIVLSGHKHVPYVWKLENLLVVNAGTVSTLRLRGRTRPCYNIIKADKEKIKIYRKQPFGEERLIVDFSLEEKKLCKWEKVEDSGGGVV